MGCILKEEYDVPSIRASLVWVILLFGGWGIPSSGRKVGS